MGMRRRTAHKRLTQYGARTNITSSREWWLTDDFTFRHKNQNNPNMPWTIDVFRTLVADGIFGESTRSEYVGQLPNFRWISKCTVCEPLQHEHIMIGDEVDIQLLMPELLKS